jgi:hypothetical protein
MTCRCGFSCTGMLPLRYRDNPLTIVKIKDNEREHHEQH